MNKLCSILLLLMILLCGCNAETGMKSISTETHVQIAESIPEYTIPADGDPNDVTCKGSYTGEAENAVIAKIGDETLANQELQVWYWAEVAQYRRNNPEIGPDFDIPLDVQPCQINNSVNSWQQYFLRQALNRWHTAQSMRLHSLETHLPTEAAYLPIQSIHEWNLTGRPATKYLYGYNAFYSPNSLHQAYLDNTSDLLCTLAADHGYSDAAALAQQAFGTTENALDAYVTLLNYGYMYFTQLTYYIEPTQEMILAYYGDNVNTFASDSKLADIRHILLVPKDAAIQNDFTVDASEDAWLACQYEAERMLARWLDDYHCSEGLFAELAHKYSVDTGNSMDGGGYQGIREGQLPDTLDGWCFDPARQPGDTTILSTEYGVHILYFCRSYTEGMTMAEDAYYQEQQLAILEGVRSAYPIEVMYSAISLSDADASVAAEEFLYPDIAHERFPEVPLYIQQDYSGTMFGKYPLANNGCGITSFSMLASYMTDEEYTPPEMCQLYGRYSNSLGTDGSIFNFEPSGLGFYLKGVSNFAPDVKNEIEAGHIVISLQSEGYWTQAGHYIVCERINEDGTVQVRDSNILNYHKLSAHKQDKHKWYDVVENNVNFWIFEHKITRIPACHRCGTREPITETLLSGPYICRKCVPALLRRNTYLMG